MIGVRLLNGKPWRFKIGEVVYVRGWPVDATAKITAQLRNAVPFPHYLAVDNDGREWRIPQLHLSTSPIIERNGH